MSGSSTNARQSTAQRAARASVHPAAAAKARIPSRACLRAVAIRHEIGTLGPITAARAGQRRTRRSYTNAQTTPIHLAVTASVLDQRLTSACQTAAQRPTRARVLSAAEARVSRRARLHAAAVRDQTSAFRAVPCALVRLGGALGSYASAKKMSNTISEARKLRTRDIEQEQ